MSLSPKYCFFSQFLPAKWPRSGGGPRGAARISALISLVLFCLSFPGLAQAQDPSYFRIGTGSDGGTYLPIGQAVAKTISQPPEGSGCQDPSCGVPDLVAVAQASSGSVANIASLASGQTESAFVQSNIVTWAYRGTGLYEEKGRVKPLRVLASLYPESVHLVARRAAQIESVSGLEGKRVGLDELGSGSLIAAQSILEAYDLSLDEIEPLYVGYEQAVERMKSGDLDAFFLVAGYPVPILEELAASVEIELLPLAGPMTEGLAQESGFIQGATIPAGTYRGVPEVETLSVVSQWVTRDDLADDLIYQILQVFWSERGEGLLQQGHPKGKAIRLDQALEGIAIPLHAGAARFYRDKGLLEPGVPVRE